VSRWSGLCLQVAPDPGDKDARDSRTQNARTWWCGLGMTGVLSGRAPRPARAAWPTFIVPARTAANPRYGRRAAGPRRSAATAPLLWQVRICRRWPSAGTTTCRRPGRPGPVGTGRAEAGRAGGARHGGRAPARVRPGARPPEAGPRLTHAAAPGAPWPAGAESPAPMPLSTFVTFRFLPNLTVTREPSAFFMCTSYAPSPASVSIR